MLLTGFDEYRDNKAHSKSSSTFLFSCAPRFHGSESFTCGFVEALPWLKGAAPHCLRLGVTNQIPPQVAVLADVMTPATHRTHCRDRITQRIPKSGSTEIRLDTLQTYGQFHFDPGTPVP